MSQGIAACSYVSLPGRLCGLGGIVRKQRNVSPAKSSALNPSMSKNRTTQSVRTVMGHCVYEPANRSLFSAVGSDLWQSLVRSMALFRNCSIRLG